MPAVWVEGVAEMHAMAADPYCYCRLQHICMPAARMQMRHPLSMCRPQENCGQQPPVSSHPPSPVSWYCGRPARPKICCTSSMPGGSRGGGEGNAISQQLQIRGSRFSLQTSLKIETPASEAPTQVWKAALLRTVQLPCRQCIRRTCNNAESQSSMQRGTHPGL